MKTTNHSTFLQTIMRMASVLVILLSFPTAIMANSMFSGSTTVTPKDLCPNRDSIDNNIYEVVPTMPQFPGGALAMRDSIAKNIKYPADAKQQGKDGTVIIQFVVEKDGSRSDVKVIRKGKLPSMDDEALRVPNSLLDSMGEISPCESSSPFPSASNWTKILLFSRHGNKMDKTMDDGRHTGLQHSFYGVLLK